MKWPILVALLVSFVSMFFSTAGGSPTTFRPVVRGSHGVVASGHPLTSAAGMRIMQQGGNAVDAAVAMILAASVVENDHFAFGGQSPILVYSPDTGKVMAINGIGTAPKLATLEFFLDKGGIQPGILRATVPPMPGAVITALDLFGTKTFAEVAEPAIEYANGFPLGEYLHKTYLEWEKLGRIKEPTTVKLMKSGGGLPDPGEIFSQPDLARTLQTLVAAEKRNLHKGRHRALMAVRREFYEGSITEEIVRYHKSNGGLHRMQDYVDFKTKVVPALSVKYKEYEIYKHGPWTQGPALLEMLNILEEFNLKGMGHNSADYAHVLIETMKLALADRDHHYGDPDFSAVPIEGLLSKKYGGDRRKQIDMEKVILEETLQGDPYKYQKKKAALVKSKGLPPGFTLVHDGGVAGTTCINVIDSFGNTVSATPSGPTGYAMPVMGNTGILINSRMGQFILDASVNPHNVVAPGKRPRTTLTPTIVLKHGKPFLALSTPGTDRQEQSILQVFLNIVEFGMNPQEAVEAPRLETLHLLSSGSASIIKRGGVNLEGRFSKEVTKDLRARGHNVTVIGDYDNNSGVTVVMFDAESGSIAGGADIRRDRYAIAW